MNAIMNEKGRQTKLLAAFAIIAMVACVFAVALPAEDADASTVTVGDGVSFEFPDYLTGTYDSEKSTITVSGVTLPAENGDLVGTDEKTTFESIFGNNTEKGYAFFMVNGLAGLVPENGTLKIVQKNAAMNGFYGPDEFTDDTKTKEYKADDVNDGLGMLIPKGDESRTVEVTIGETKYTIDFTDVTTVAGTVVKSETELTAALEDENVSNILIGADFSIANSIRIDKTVNIYGNGYTISASGSQPWTGSQGTDKILNIVANTYNVGLYDLVVDNRNASYGINVYGGTVVVDNVTSINSVGAGLIIGGNANVTVTESSMQGAWGGINVDGGTVEIDSMDNLGSVYSENYKDGTTITIADGGVSPVKMTGTWKANKDSSTSTFGGFYESIDDAVSPYNDSRIVKDSEQGDLPIITVNNNTVLTTDFTVSAGIFTVATGATLVVDENVNLDVSKATATGNYIASAGSSIAFADGTTAVVAAASGAKVTEIDSEGKVTDMKTVEAATADDFAEALELAGNGVPVTISKDVPLSENVTISSGMDIRMADGKKVILGTNTITTDNATFSGTVAGTDAEAKIALSGSYTIKSASVDVDGRISGSIDVVNGTTVITGTVDGDLEISGAGEVIFRDVTVNSNADITILGGDAIQYTVEGKFWLYGGLLIADDDTSATVTVAAKSEFKAFGNATIAPSIAVVGTDSTSKIDLGDAMGTQYIRQDVTSNLVYSQTQTVIIEESIFIKKSASLTVYGQLIVNEGVEVIIEDGGKLIVNNQTAKVTINGDIEVENGGAMDIKYADAVDISGTVTSDGTLTINSKVTVKSGGKILTENGDASEFTIEGEGAKLAVNAGGNVEIRGQAAVSDITNKGTVTLNGAILNGDVKISMASDAAVVDIKSFTSSATASKLVITDDGLVFKSGKNSVKVGSEDANTLTINGQANGGIRNLVITEEVTSETVNRETTYYNSFILSGSVTIADETTSGDGIAAVQIDVAGPSVDVVETLTIGKGVTLNLVSGNLDVSGTITATADGATVKATGGDINVSGMIETCVEITANINAFSYEGTLDGETVYYYTTLKTAIDNGQTDIEALGTTSVLESVDIPAGTEIKAGPGHEKIIIGSSDARDVVVTVKDGGEFRSCIIDVMGTLTFDNKRDDRNNTITSDVFVEGDVSKSYTNIYTALNNAQAGETVTIYRSGSNVILDRDITVKEGVTLDIPSGKGVSVVDNVTVTVDGTIRNSGELDNVKYDSETEAYVAGSGFNPEVDNNATIIVNGAFMAVDEIPYADDTANAVQGYYIPGAYYNLVNTSGNWNYVTPIEQAAAVSNDVSEGLITIRGTNQVGDVTFTGDENTPVAIALEGKLTASSLTLTYASIDVVDDDNGYQFDGTIVTDVGSIEFVNANGFDVLSDVNDEGETVMTLSGAPAQADAEGADVKVTVASGNVTVANTVADGDDLDVTGTEFVISNGATLTVDGVNAKLNAKDLSIDGTLVAYDGGNVTAVNVYVIGTFTVSPADSENDVQAGSATVSGVIRVGISDDFETTTSAALNADKIGDWNNMYVSAESTVTEDLVKSKEYTQFFVEDALWFTVYANTTADRTVVTPEVIPTENALLQSWTGTDVNGDTQNYNGGAHFNINAVERFDANVNYDIYRVTIFADPGISAVYIDGKLMTSGYFENPLGGSDNVTMAAGFQAYVSAGEHEITYKLGNYFSGEAEMTVNGDAVTGNKFTTSGMPDKDAVTGDYKTSVDYVVYLQGIEASAPETPSTPTTGGDSGEGMGLTDYLLIVLIVLIVVMAILVAVRLMRS